MQYTNGATTNYGANLNRKRRNHQDVGRVTVIRNGLGDIAVVGGVMHGSQHEAVYIYRSRLLIHPVLDGVGVHGIFVNAVEFVWHLGGGGDAAEAHACNSAVGNSKKV